MAAASTEHDERTPLLPAQISKTPNGSANGNGNAAASSSRLTDDDLDFDARFRKWKTAVARKFRGKQPADAKPVLLITHFDGLGQAQSVLEAKRALATQSAHHEVTAMTSDEFQQQVEQVKHAIRSGVYPKMITTGSSGSYFVRIISDPSTDPPSTTTVAVFKPKDEEPYGNLNPKRQLLRKYFWWAMGRPCLIPNFSYLSEVGASYLDSRLGLQMVPRTELVELSSPTFHYAFNDRMAYERDNTPLPAKIGSYQTFLKGYMNASDFLRKHPWPSRSRSKTLLLRDMEDESRAHKVSRKKEKARLRNCGVAIKRALLCRPDWEELFADHEGEARDVGSSSSSPAEPVEGEDGFYWTPKRMEQFRLQLERLVVLDFLMRNTDRGLDNFMIKHDSERDEITIGAIDNSLSFPIKHPNEIRQYPFGWLWLPSDLIGLPFSDEVRTHVVPILNDPSWWQETEQGLRRVLEQDAYFDETKFARQMSVMRGQGWTLVQSLRAEDEGPLDLCAREKKLIRQEVVELAAGKIAQMEGVKYRIDAEGVVVGRAELEVSRVGGKPGLARAVSSGVVEMERRPIGMRASESYRKALLRAAGTQVDGNERRAVELPSDNDDDRVPANPDAAISSLSTSFPHTSSRASTMRAAQAQGDSILGRTGIEVLEGLDRERRQRDRRGLFHRRNRSSTVTTTNTPAAMAEVVEERRSRQISEPRVGDLASSIMSDPGGSSRWGERARAKSTSRQGMVGSLYDLQSQGEVLSEEEEEDEEEENEEQSRRGAVPTIEGVLKAGEAQQLAEQGLESYVAAGTGAGARKGTVRVVIDKISSDTKQAWLKWI